MTSPNDVAPRVNGDLDAKSLARLLVLQKAILDVLKDADAELREQARAIFESGDAAVARNGEGELGRVRRDKPSEEWYVHDFTEYDAWARANVPEACTAVAPWLIKAIKRDGGVYLRRETGEVLEPAGVALKRQAEGNLVVTTTPAAQAWANHFMDRTVAGEIGV